MSSCVQYPGTGCIVEFLEGNAVHLALVIEEGGGKVRLLLPNRRETRLGTSRLLPWSGPQLPGPLPGREEAVRLLDDVRKRREALAAAVPVAELWEMAQGELAEAPAQWFAELSGSDPDVDSIAAHGRALLACKSHFRFQPPVFQIFDAETVERRLHEQQEREEREALTVGGATFFRLLWDVACRKRTLPPAPDADGHGGSPEWPAPEVAQRLRKLLFDCMANPDNQEHDTLWRMLSKGLPDVPHLPVQLLMAWGEVPPHYNFWFDRAGYEPGDQWWTHWADEVEDCAAQSREMPLERCDLPFISIDSASTRDVDDAFFLEDRPDGGFLLTLALACPALCWPFGSPLDKAVLRRGTSIYLPEGDCHMLPETLGTDVFSLRAGEDRPVLWLGVSSNVTYKYETTTETVDGVDVPRGHVFDLRVNGKEVKDDDTFKVAGNSFLLAGGDNFTVFQEGADYVDTGFVDLDGFVEYLKANPNIVAPKTRLSAGFSNIKLDGDTLSFDVTGLAYTAGEATPKAIDLHVNGVDFGVVEGVNAGNYQGASNGPGAGWVSVSKTLTADEKAQLLNSSRTVGTVDFRTAEVTSLFTDAEIQAAKDSRNPEQADGGQGIDGPAQSGDQDRLPQSGSAVALAVAGAVLAAAGATVVAVRRQRQR